MSRSRVMLLTGCASGIGRHMAEVFAKAGHRLVATDIDEAALKQWAEQADWSPSQVVIRKLDVRQPLEWQQAIQEAVRRWGRIDVVMNIAGHLKAGELLDTVLGEIDLHIDVNVKGVIFGTQAAAAQMVRQGWGHIINIGSVASLTPVPGLSLYSASKFAVRGFSLAVAQELESAGVAVTVVLPHAVDTPMLEQQAECEQSAMTFAGPQPLSLAEVEQVLMETVLPKKPLEVVIPTSRAKLVKLAHALPEVSKVIAPILGKTSSGPHKKAPGRHGSK